MVATNVPECRNCFMFSFSTFTIFTTNLYTSLFIQRFFLFIYLFFLFIHLYMTKKKTFARRRTKARAKKGKPEDLINIKLKNGRGKP